MEAVIERFIAPTYGSGHGSGHGYGSGYGYGDGHGSGHGSGYGDGDGSGYGYGYGAGAGDGYGAGYGDGDGSGYGYGSGYGAGAGDGYGAGDGAGAGDGYGADVSSFNGEPVHMIDGVQTIIYSVKGNIAKGAILMDDLTLKPCYIARVGDSFAHGDTPADALRDATEKYNENRPIPERVEAFLDMYPPDKSHSGHDLFNGHKLLTGSCESGRRAFVLNNGINLDAMYTLDEFVALTINAYGNEAIEALRDRINLPRKESAQNEE